MSPWSLPCATEFSCNVRKRYVPTYCLPPPSVHSFDRIMDSLYLSHLFHHPHLIFCIMKESHGRTISVALGMKKLVVVLISSAYSTISYSRMCPLQFSTNKGRLRLFGIVFITRSLKSHCFMTVWSTDPYGLD